MSNSNELLNVVIGIIIIFLCFFSAKFNSKLLNVPNNIKCIIPYNNCESADIQIYNLCIGLLFFWLGFNNPNNLIYYIIPTLFIEYALSPNPSYIIAILINITAYTIGSVLANKYKRSILQNTTY